MNAYTGLYQENLTQLIFILKALALLGGCSLVVWLIAKHIMQRHNSLGKIIMAGWCCLITILMVVGLL